MTMIFVKEAAKALPHSERAFQVAKVSGASENYAVSIGYSPERNLRLLSIVLGLLLSDGQKLKLTLVSSHTDDQVQSLMQELRCSTTLAITPCKKHCPGKLRHALVFLFTRSRVSWWNL